MKKLLLLLLCVPLIFSCGENKKEVIKIESLYKEKFGTRAFGLNEN